MKRFKGINQFYLLAIGLTGIILAFITWEGEYRAFNRWPLGSQIGVVIFSIAFVILIGQYVAAIVYQLIHRK